MSAYELNKTILKDSSSLKAYYRFESGALTTDSSGNAKTLTNNSATETTGVYGGATATNGSSQYYSIADALVTGATNWSVSAWIKNPSASQLGSPWYCGVTGTNGFGLIFTNGGAGGAGKQISMILHGVGWLFTGVDMPDTTNYHHIVVTRDASTMRFYLNGKHIYSSATAPAAPGALFSVSRDGATGTYYFNGSTDDLAVFSTALSADQIKELYEGRYIGEWMPQSGLVGLWHLNGNSTDSSGNNNHGTDTAMTYALANGKVNKGGVFNGSTSYINYGNILGYERTNSFSVLAWVKYIGTTGGHIVGKKNNSSPYDGWGMNAGAGTNIINVDLTNNNTTSSASKNFTKTCNDGVFHLVGFTSDGTSNTSGIKLYFDGTEDAGTSIANNLTTSITNAKNFQIGARDGANFPFTGSIDEVAIFSRVLTPAEIRHWYAWSVGKYL